LLRVESELASIDLIGQEGHLTYWKNFLQQRLSLVYLWKTIDLKFDLDDYVGGLTVRAKHGANQPSRAGRAKGWNMMFNWVIFSFFCFFVKL